MARAVQAFDWLIVYSLIVYTDVYNTDVYNTVMAVMLMTEYTDS